MAFSTLKQDSENLLETLNNLLQEGHKSNCINFKTFDCKDGFVIYNVPSNFQHLLKDIVKSVKNGFFLVSKLPVVDKGLHDESTESVAECGDQEIDLTLPVVTRQHVFIGTPISQKLYRLFQQHDLHSWEAETVEKHIDVSGVEKLNIKHTRYFLSLYIQCLRLQKGLPEVWMMCDASSPQRATFMGMVPNSAVDTSSAKSLQPVSSVMVRHQIISTTEKDGFTLKEQKKMHMALHKARQTETHCYARYNIFGALESLEKGSDRPESSISMEFAWDGVREILQPPPPSSNAVLSICAHPEDVKSILSAITIELNTLLNHFAVVQSNACEPTETEVFEEFDKQELKTNVLAFLEDLKLNSFGTNEPKSESQSPSNLAEPFGISEALRRQDLDNTECLWLFLKDFTSVDKILFCIQIIFTALFEGEYQPVLCITNQTQIAKFLKKVVCSKSERETAIIKIEVTQTFSTSTALDCVLEIGLEKLRKDYTNYFVKQELVTKDKLDYYLAKDVPVAEKVQRLLKLHCILSVVALAISYAHIKYHDLRELVVAAFKFYEKHSHTEHPVFSLSLPAFSALSDVKNVCIHQFQPQTWMVAITTAEEYITVVKVEENDQDGTIFESILDQEKSCKGLGYSATTATASQICI